MFTNPSIVPKGKGAPEDKSLEIILMLVDDIAGFPNRNERGVLMEGSYVMKPGKYATKVQVTSSKTTLPFNSEGEEDNVSLKSLPEFYIPGSTLLAEELVQNWTNRSIIAAVRIGACGGENTFNRIYGSQCAPLTLLAEGQNDNDATMIMLKFQQFSKTQLLPARYTGNFTFDTATAVPADAVDIDVSDGPGEYQLSDNALATVIADITNASTGAVYTIKGSGGDNPATIQANNADFLLAGAIDWQGLAGSTITLQAFDNGGGDFVFIEKSRT